MAVTGGTLEERPDVSRRPATEAKGVNGQVTFEEGWVNIERKGFGRLGHSRGAKRIKASQVVGIKFRPPGLMSNGFIAFEVAGRPFNGGLSQASKDDNAVIFKKKQLAVFEGLRHEVEQAVSGV